MRVFYGGKSLRSACFSRAVAIRRRCHQGADDSLNKKLLAPLIKKIHPDFYMNDSDEVHATNLNCLQNINELWESIVSLSRKTISGDSISINAPFKLAYALKCFVRIDNEKVVKKERIIKIPIELCTRGNTIAVARKPGLIRKILKQFGQFYIDLNIQNPWEALATNALHENKSDASIDEFTLDVYEKKAELKILERVIKQSYRFNNAIKQDNIYNKVDDLLNQSGLKTKFNPKFATVTDHEIDVFIRYGNVMSKELPVVEEYHVITKFHKFLKEYAGLINFNLDYWKSVLVIIYFNHNPVVISNRQRKKAIKEGNRDCYNHLYKLELMESLVQGSSTSATADSTSKDITRIDVKGKEYKIKYVVSIPHDYIDRFLLEFLQQQLPVCNHLHTLSHEEETI